MRNISKATLLLIFAVLLLSACSASLKEEQNAVKDAVTLAFKSEPKETNKENKDIKYYLPFGIEVKEESPNNIILKSGSKTYILFYNQHEESNSKIVYNATMKQKEYDVNETFDKDQKFGFLLIKNTDKKINEMTIGIGGVKITSQSKTKQLASDAKIMSEIIHSVTMK
ncbi:outer membrane lipopolysaccharide assembly protein LptE/RlpB [Cytobacillus eiseniae]|uniref:Outer membrane lipopolysaccharide assembly protein LptE/RlpB n=1 Tax=Cytobacillus eiseniae TaxID=762947 RepID=A0ABS4REX6_9BACI|nr:hypothetical protein [Cytobacillus eiseniae]MBP2241450.1 outer membrane lipopolysaccharide assembly protein LptE/RlpB [Cytobacillus eiseniae]